VRISFGCGDVTIRCSDEVKSGGDGGRLNNLHAVSASAREWKANFQYPPTTITLRDSVLRHHCYIIYIYIYIYSRTMLLYYNIRVHSTCLLSALYIYLYTAGRIMLQIYNTYICTHKYAHIVYVLYKLLFDL
jgi:hypothetical protein